MKKLVISTVFYAVVLSSSLFAQESFLPQVLQDIIIEPSSGIIDPNIVEFVSGLEGNMIIEKYRKDFPLDEDLKFVLVDSSKTMPLFGNTQQVWRYELQLNKIPLIGPHFTLMELNGKPHKINYNWPQRNFLPKPQDIKINNDYEINIIESLATDFLKQHINNISNPIIQGFKEKLIYSNYKEQFIHCLELYYKDGRLAYSVSVDLVNKKVLFVNDLLNYQCSDCNVGSEVPSSELRGYVGDHEVKILYYQNGNCDNQ